MSVQSTRERPARRQTSGSSSAVRRQGTLRLGNPRKRAGLLTLFTAIVMLIFAGRLIEVQVVKGGELAIAAVDQRLRTVELPAGRGSIVDANGEPLAVTVVAQNLTVDQSLVVDPAAAALAIAPILRMTVADVTAKLTGDRRFAYVAKQLTPATWNRIEALHIPGLFNEETSTRVYPGGDLGANVVGFVGADGVGLGGIELGYNSLLAGTAGSTTYERGSGGRAIPATQRSHTEALPGSSVKLTIDRDIQHIAQDAISAQVAASKSDSGTVVVMESSTGRILALAEAPTFNSNNAGAADEADRGNRALSDVYEPGSTSKVMTLAAVIDRGAANPLSTFTIPSSLTRGGKVFHDSSPHGTLKLTLAGVMAKSSNMGAILAAERIGGRSLYDYIRRFGIGEKAGLNFPGESTGSMPKFKDWTATSFPTIAFGQGLSVNAVQAASVFATIANDGVRVAPSIVDSTIGTDGSTSPAPAPVRTKVVSPQAAKQVRTMLESVVSKGGTAPVAKIPGYRVGGKTGTAMYVDPTCGCYNGGVVASFIGIAPADKPELVVAVSLVNPRNGRFGGELAAPVFKEVMTYALQSQQIPPTGSRPPNLPLTWGKG